METLETWRSYRGNTGKHTLVASWEKSSFFGGSIRETPAFAFPPHQRQAVLGAVPSFISSNGAQKPSSGAHFVKARCGWTLPSTVNPKKVDRESRIKNLATWTSYRNNWYNEIAVLHPPNHLHLENLWPFVATVLTHPRYLWQNLGRPKHRI